MADEHEKPDIEMEAARIWLKATTGDFFDGPETKQTEMFWKMLTSGAYPEDADKQIQASAERSLERWMSANAELAELLEPIDSTPKP